MESEDNCERDCAGTWCPVDEDADEDELLAWLKDVEDKAARAKAAYKGDPVAKNCAFGCDNGKCPKNRKPGDTNGCAAWESGDSYCNLSKQNCNSCKTKRYGRGQWCPASAAAEEKKEKKKEEPFVAPTPVVPLMVNNGDGTCSHILPPSFVITCALHVCRDR